MVALVIMPLLFGHTLHCLIPCTSDFYNSNTSETAPCAVCKFLSLPRDIAQHVAWHCVFDLVERREPEPVRQFIVLYRSFEPGRAPPIISQGPPLS